MATGEFSVVQFFDDDSYEKVRQFVTAGEAMLAANHYCDSVAAKIGMVKKVIITDGGDCIVFEWRYKEGIVFPPQQEKAHG